jgi:hypothetical protein
VDGAEAVVGAAAVAGVDAVDCKREIDAGDRLTARDLDRSCWSMPVIKKHARSRAARLRPARMCVLNSSSSGISICSLVTHTRSGGAVPASTLAFARLRWLCPDCVLNTEPHLHSLCSIVTSLAKLAPPSRCTPSEDRCDEV